jgi:hypothetical protein
VSASLGIEADMDMNEEELDIVDEASRESFRRVIPTHGRSAERLGGRTRTGGRV